MNDINESAIQTHIMMLQGIINRMASNCANCKTWAITIVAAMLVLIVDDSQGFSKSWICFFPIFLFFILDSYYLGLERIFIKKQNDFVKNIPTREYKSELFLVDASSSSSQMKEMLSGMKSISTMPFYGLVLLFIILLSNWCCITNFFSRIFC